MVGDAIVWVRGNIVEELVDIGNGGLSRHGLLGANVAESNKKFVVDRVSIFCTHQVEICIGSCRLLGLGAVGNGVILVQI